jgi:DNA-binding transcriptional ArsR family regulator
MLAERLHAIAEPTRIRILTLLEQREASVQELTDELGASTTHQNTSKHLSVLIPQASSHAAGRAIVPTTLSPTTPLACLSEMPLQVSSHM